MTAGVPQGAIWSPPLFNLYIRQLPSVVRHSLIVGYVDNHSLLKIIPDKTDRIVAVSDLNSDLAALHHFAKLANQICSSENILLDNLFKT